jgi:hypothetical protein
MEKVSGFASFGGFTCAANKYVSFITIIVEFYMVPFILNIFEILKFRQGGGIDDFVKNSIFQKCPKFITSQSNKLLYIIYNVSEPGDVEFPIFGDSLSFMKFCRNVFFFKVSGFASLGGFTCAPNKYVSLITVIVEFYIVSCYLIFFEILKFRQGGGIDVFVKNSIFQKCLKFIISHSNKLLYIIYNVSESGDVEFPIFGDIFSFMKF